MTKHTSQKRAGFTLIELLVVVAILAIIAGAIIAAYDGLEEKAAQGVATYDIGALNSAIRTYKVTNGVGYPTNMDSLMFSTDGSGTDADFLNIIDADGNSLRGKLGSHTLTAEGAGALSSAGVNVIRYVSATNGYDNSALPAGTQPNVPNRVFDSPGASGPGGRRFGVAVPVTAGLVVAAMENIGQADF